MASIINFSEEPLGMAGLVLANSAQLTFNAAVTGILLRRALGGLRGEGFGHTALKATLAEEGSAHG